MLDYPLCSLRQDVELIVQARQDEAKLEMKLTAWHARTLSSFAVRTAQVDQKGFNVLWREVQAIQLGEDPDKQGGVHDTRSIDQIIEEGAIIPDDKIQTGTYEAFMGLAEK